MMPDPEMATIAHAAIARAAAYAATSLALFQASDVEAARELANKARVYLTRVASQGVSGTSEIVIQLAVADGDTGCADVALLVEEARIVALDLLNCANAAEADAKKRATRNATTTEGGKSS